MSKWVTPASEVPDPDPVLPLQDALAPLPCTDPLLYSSTSHHCMHALWDMLPTPAAACSSISVQLGVSPSSILSFIGSPHATSP